ncbi:sensor histidine kinase [Amycolatopsis minnesotensis]
MKLSSRFASAAAKAEHARWSPLGTDIAVALLLATVTVVIASDDDVDGAWWLASAIAIAAAGVRHRLPLVTFTAGLGAAFAHLVLGNDVRPVDVVVLIGLYTVASRGPQLRAIALVLIGFVVAGGWSIYENAVTEDEHASGMARIDDSAAWVPPPPCPPLPRQPFVAPPCPVVPVDEARTTTWGGFPVLGLALTVTWLTGLTAQQRRVRLAELRQRAEDLERERDTRAALAVAAERGRISRELHDVVAHALSVVVLQAQGGAAELARRPERTGEALEAIVDTGRTALAETRLLLGSLGQDAPEWQPRPGVERVPQLVEEARGAGTGVRLRVDGQPHPLPPAVDLAAYRIVQEALTNTRKHAGAGASAAIVLRYAPTALEIDVTDDGTAPDRDTTPGQGIRGMRERVTVLGGAFEAGPIEEGGFAVHATLPLLAGRP